MTDGLLLRTSSKLAERAKALLPLIDKFADYSDEPASAL